MLRYTANIAFLFPELPFLDRIDAAKACGFSRVECHFPYDIPIETLKARLDAAGISMNGLNTTPGGEGEFGRAGVPGREADFRADFENAVRYAEGVGAGAIHTMAGVVEASRRAEGRKTYIENLRWAARAVADKGLTLLLEPLNRYDRPGYLVSTSDAIVEIIAEIGEPNVKLLFDIYHVQIEEGDIIRRLERHMPTIGHVQVAAVPSRREPDEGEVRYGHVLRALDEMGYGGLVGLEYKPRGDTREGLIWLDVMGFSLRE